MEKNLIQHDAAANRQAFGANGFDDLTAQSTLNTDNRYISLIAEGDTVFAFENDCPKGIQNSASYSLPDGRERHGYFKNIDVASGKLTAYHAE